MTNSSIINAWIQSPRIELKAHCIHLLVECDTTRLARLHLCRKTNVLGRSFNRFNRCEPLFENDIRMIHINYPFKIAFGLGQTQGCSAK